MKNGGIRKKITDGYANWVKLKFLPAQKVFGMNVEWFGYRGAQMKWNVIHTLFQAGNQTDTAFGAFQRP